MTAEDLRKSILQQAIQGKLVPQDPNDEPAAVLLERIREEKARLIKEKKIKKDKNESIIFRGDDNSYYEKILATGEVKCIDDEIPFEIPESWEWVRMGFLVDFSKSISVKADKISADSWVLDLEDIEKGTGKVLAKKRMHAINAISDKHSFKKGNILYSKLRPYLNKVVIADEDGYCTSEILCFDFGMIYNLYAQVYLMSPFFVGYAMKDAYGVKMPRLGSKQGNYALMPIPPVEEQYRIIEKLSEIHPLIEQYSESQIKLETLNNEIKGHLKKSILQEAIQGKLVAQCDSDEPATDLLKRIQEEKLNLLKQGKLKKKDIQDSNIFRADDNRYYEKVGNEMVCINDELPFDIPQTWTWINIGALFYIQTGASFKKEQANSMSKGVRILRGGNISPDYYSFKDDDIFIDESLVASSILLRKNDLITPAVTSLENVGKMARVLEDYDDVSAGGFVFILRPHLNNEVHSQYLCAAIQSPYLTNKIKSITKKSGSAFYNIGKERLVKLYLPLPPLAEQSRIVNALNSVLKSIEG